MYKKKKKKNKGSTMSRTSAMELIYTNSPSINRKIEKRMKKQMGKMQKEIDKISCGMTLRENIIEFV